MLLIVCSPSAFICVFQCICMAGTIIIILFVLLVFPQNRDYSGMHSPTCISCKCQCYPAIVCCKVFACSTGCSSCCIISNTVRILALVAVIIISLMDSIIKHFYIMFCLYSGRSMFGICVFGVLFPIGSAWLSLWGSSSHYTLI